MTKMHRAQDSSAAVRLKESLVMGVDGEDGSDAEVRYTSFRL